VIGREVSFWCRMLKERGKGATVEKRPGENKIAQGHDPASERKAGEESLSPVEDGKTVVSSRTGKGNAGRRENLKARGQLEKKNERKTVPALMRSGGRGHPVGESLGKINACSAKTAKRGVANNIEKTSLGRKERRGKCVARGAKR